MALVDTGLFILRLGLGLIFLYHGFPKLMKPGIVAKMLKWKTPLVVGLGLVEVLAALSIVLGFYAPVGALFLALVMVGAIVHKAFIWKTPFASMKATGWEFDLMLFTASLAIALIGPGLIAVQIFL